MQKTQIPNSGFIRLTQMEKHSKENKILGDIIIPIHLIYCVLQITNSNFTRINIDKIIDEHGWIVVEESENTIAKFLAQVIN